MGGQNMKEAKKEGADFMVTPCPLCHMSLDIYQERAGRAVQANLDLPILHLPQFIGLAMGMACLLLPRFKTIDITKKAFGLK